MIRAKPLRDGRPAWEIIIELPRDPATGRRRRLSKMFRGTRREAEKEQDRLRAEVLRQGPTASRPDRTPLRDFLAAWLPRHVVEKELRPTTATSYDERIRCQIVPALGAVRLADLTPATVQEWIGDMRAGSGPFARPVSPRTAAYARTVLRVALQDAVMEGRIPLNPVDRTRPPKQRPRRVGAFTPEEADLLFERADRASRIGNLLRLAFWTGLRRGELLGLRWADVDLEAGLLSVRASRVRVRGRAVEQDPKSAAGRRTLHLPAPAVEALRRQRADQARERLAAGETYEDRGYVFATALGRGLSPTNVSRDFRRLRDAAGLRPLPLHALRHANASVMVASGVDPVVAAKRLGHARVSLYMDTYGHLYGDADAEAARRIDQFRAAKGGERVEFRENGSKKRRRNGTSRG
jgi:integrase